MSAARQARAEVSDPHRKMIWARQGMQAAGCQARPAAAESWLQPCNGSQQRRIRQLQPKADPGKRPAALGGSPYGLEGASPQLRSGRQRARALDCDSLPATPLQGLRLPMPGLFAAAGRCCPSEALRVKHLRLPCHNSSVCLAFCGGAIAALAAEQHVACCRLCGAPADSAQGAVEVGWYAGSRLASSADIPLLHI